MKRLIALLILLPLLGMGGGQYTIPWHTGAAAAAGGSFSYKFAITIDHTKAGSSDSAHFPVLFRSPVGTVSTAATAVTWVSGDTFPAWLAGLPIAINGTVYTVLSVTTSTALVLSTSAGTQTGVAFSGTPTLATVANGGHVQSSTGYDIYFYSDPGLTTRLPAEREIYSATGNYTGWINVTNVSHTADTTIYVAYGNSGISSDPNSDGTYGKTSVWDTNYKGVWHLPNGTTLTANDSTSNGNNGTNSGATATTGQIDGGASFNGSSNYISAPASTSLNSLGSAFTVSAWINQSVLQNYNAIISKDNINLPAPFDFYITSDGTANFYLGNGSDHTFIQTTLTSTNTWMLIEYLYDGSRASIYNNGTLVAGPTIIYNAVGDAGNALYIGSRYDGVTHMNGSIDEARVSNIARSADWIKTEYNNQSSPSTFYTVGAETTP